MTDDDKALVERLRSRAKWLEPELDVMDENEVLAAANRIEAQAAEIERLREAIAGPEAWLDSWAQHVGKCQGGYVCTCGLVLARTELSAALKRGEVSE